jgi:hypothetical protein
MVPAALACVLLLTACGGPKVGDAFDGAVNTYEGVTMTVLQDTVHPGTASAEVLNTTDADIQSGNTALFALQVEQDGQWYWLVDRRGDFATTSEALIYPKDEPVRLDFTWGSAFGSLPKGHYRLVKSFFEYRGPGDYTDFTLAAEFTRE